MNRDCGHKKKSNTKKNLRYYEFEARVLDYYTHFENIKTLKKGNGKYK